MNYSLTKSEHQLLLRLVNSRRKQSKKVFDKHDNCFRQTTFRELAELTTESKSNIHRLFSKLKSIGLLETVINVNDQPVPMLNPTFLCCKPKWQKKFMEAMYSLGSHDEAIKWAKLCREDFKLYSYSEPIDICEIIDVSTGEVLTIKPKVVRNLSQHEVREWEFTLDSYTSIDRCKRRPSSLVS
ncbi:MarR family transcriptional regulator [Vibrio mediterranei]|uniref:MarR family transcriptional regulator n=1 Tax=Vibrio mediterranei TaxID=689 RepID=UPI0022845165|nr:MarR family transcriptional regulator [Vibrio mediterranei]MCY9853229.1 MarR family transcriptional regulator [Vibrio mediterranei]